MSKHRYHTENFKQINWNQLASKIDGRQIAFAIDVAKEDFVAGFIDEDQQINKLIKWKHPQQTQALLDHLTETFPAEQLCAVMEPSGSYGDSLRAKLVDLGITVYRVSPKRVHDVAEVYDGVPSLHDAKAAWLIGLLHWQGVSEVWEENSSQRRTLKAQLTELSLYKGRLQRGLNRFEALLSRHWPEVESLLDRDSATFLQLIKTYGDPAQIAANSEAARTLMQKTGGHFLRPEKIDQVLSRAQHSVGVPCIEAERQLLQTFARDLLETRQSLRKIEALIKTQVKQDAATAQVAEVVGDTTAAVLSASLGSAINYEDPDSYLKSAGMNLKERSSGKHKGQLKLTKRGPSIVRYYLYFAALRLIQKDLVVRTWYRAKVSRDGGYGGKAIVAIMRKLIKGLWHVARGEAFDTTKLFNIEHLALS